MRKKYWLSYFVYAVVLVCYIIFSDKILENIIKQSQITFNMLPYMIWSCIAFVILLGLDKILVEREKVGKWKVNLKLNIKLFFSILLC
jgi:uncharacterized membrane protein YhaH (DUF805 family)